MNDQDVAVVCDRCERPVVPVFGTEEWEHAEYADAVFCMVVMRAGEQVPGE